MRPLPRALLFALLSLGCATARPTPVVAAAPPCPMMSHHDVEAGNGHGCCSRKSPGTESAEASGCAMKCHHGSESADASDCPMMSHHASDKADASDCPMMSHHASDAPQVPGSPMISHPAPTVARIALPGSSAGPIFMDYIAYDPSEHRIWVPAANTGKVEVVDAVDGKVTDLGGFATSESDRHGKKWISGPSSAAVGNGVVFVGSQADGSICGFDAKTLQKLDCLKLAQLPDGLAFVASRSELWVTTPHDHSIQILKVGPKGALSPSATVRLEGEPEGFAVDDARGLIYTNLEDQDRTLAIGLEDHALRHSWPAGCGEDGPKGLSLDHARNELLVACASSVKVVDAATGKALSQLETGEGVDNIDYAESHHTLYVGAARAGTLTVAQVNADGQLQLAATIPTAKGARNGVVAADGSVFLTDSHEGALLKVTAPVHSGGRCCRHGSQPGPVKASM